MPANELGGRADSAVGVRLLPPISMRTWERPGPATVMHSEWSLGNSCCRCCDGGEEPRLSLMLGCFYL